MSNFNDCLTVAELRDNLDTVLQRARETTRPFLVTDGGNPVVIVINAKQYEREQESIAYLAAIIEGLTDIVGGRVVTHEEVEARLDRILEE